jgi:D-alanyl-D-alanine dipeptidase
MRTCSKRLILIIAFLVTVGLPFVPEAPASGVPEGFVDVSVFIPGIPLDMRYHTAHNFVGRPIEGYHAPKCFLTRQAAAALRLVQEELKPFSLSLKLYDCYRPQRAVDHFLSWSKDAADTKMRKEFYPFTRKERLFKEGYIAPRSSHSRGSAVDVTIVPIPLPPQEEYREGQDLCECQLPIEERFGDNSLDMGTGYDCFHIFSWTASRRIGPQQRANRLLLKTLMERHGFVNFDKEWWHFRLKDEPFPDTYFDFPIK